jgi:hypothetical protein
MTPEVEEAIDEIKRHFHGHPVLVGPDKDGGACVIVEDADLGPSYAHASWIGFHITASCPYADVYPHFVRSDLARADKRALGEAISPGHNFPQPGVVVGGNMPSRPAMQVSRRSNKREANSDLETPLLKTLKVLRWLSSR